MDNNNQISNKTSSVSGLSIVAFVLSFFGIFAIICLILAMVDLGKKDGRKKGLSIATLIISILWIVIGCCLCGGLYKKGDSDGGNSSSSNSAITSLANDTNETPSISMDDYKNQCEAIDYKELSRYSDTYVGKKIKLIVKVSQILEGNWGDKNTYYRVYSYSEDSWFGDEYILKDSREYDTTKILQDDYLIIYGEYEGTREMVRALTGTKENVPSIEMVYADIIDEEKASIEASGNAEILLDDTIDVEFDNCRYKYDGYELTKDRNDNNVIIIYFTFENNGEEATHAGKSSTVKVFQEGIECEKAYISNKPEEIDNAWTDIKNGAEIRFAEAFVVPYDSEIEIEFYKGYSKLKDKMMINME